MSGAGSAVGDEGEEPLSIDIAQAGESELVEPAKGEVVGEAQSTEGDRLGRGVEQLDEVVALIRRVGQPLVDPQAADRPQGGRYRVHGFDGGCGEESPAAGVGRAADAATRDLGAEPEAVDFAMVRVHEEDGPPARVEGDPGVQILGIATCGSRAIAVDQEVIVHRDGRSVRELPAAGVPVVDAQRIAGQSEGGAAGILEFDPPRGGSASPGEQFIEDQSGIAGPVIGSARAGGVREVQDGCGAVRETAARDVLDLSDVSYRFKLDSA